MKLKARTSLKLKNNYDSDKIHDFLDSLDFLSFDEKQLISAKFKLFIGFEDEYAQKEAEIFVTDILNGTHPIIHLKH